MDRNAGFRARFGADSILPDPAMPSRYDLLELTGNMSAGTPGKSRGRAGVDSPDLQELPPVYPRLEKCVF